ncbi:MAG TPA: hypothetical protein VJT31_33120, partial [Rugosimonospora sp.]|nr:hypothetical protein [Rugosimonospora sp.]
ATLLHRAVGTAPVVIEQPELVVAEGCLAAPSSAPTDASATVLVPRVTGEVVAAQTRYLAAVADYTPPPPEPVSPVPAYAPQPAYHPPPAYDPPPADDPPVYAAPAAGGGGFRSFLRAVLVTLLLGVTPVVAAYVTYKLTLHQPMLPIRVDWQRFM